MSDSLPLIEVMRHDGGQPLASDGRVRATAAPSTIAAGESDRIPRLFLAVVDLCVLGLSFWVARALAPVVQRLFLKGGPFDGLLPGIVSIPALPTVQFPAMSELLWLPIVTAPVTLVVMELVGGYRPLLGQPARRLVFNAVTAQAVAIGFGALTVVALKVPTSSRVVMFTFALTATAGLVAYRSAFWLHQRRKFRSGAYAKNILIIGHPSAARRIAQHFGRYTHAHEFRLAGWLNTGEPGVGGARLHQQDTPAAARVEPLGHVADLADLLVHHPVHEVIAVESGPGQTWIADVIEHCDYYRVRLRIVPEGLLAGGLDETPLVFRGDRLGLPQIVISPPLLDAEVLFVKRVMDIVLAALLLVVLAPVLLLVALAIKITTPHLPVLYRWRVIGLNGRPFTGYKFTTMVADADEQKAALLPRNEMQGPVFKLTNDPRITPLGRLLRKFSLNELPQLWSVLIGDMSLVGPRPAFRHELERYERWHKRKLCVKPGITCLWQVSGRNRITDFDEWVRLDLQYIDEWSLWLDLRILGRTLWAVVSGSGS